MELQYRNVSDVGEAITIGKVYTGQIDAGQFFFKDDDGDGRHRTASKYEQVIAASGGPCTMSPVPIWGGIGTPPETDPNGLNLHTPGAKADAGKPLAAQILSQFPRALAGVAEVGTFGAKKYSLGGWLKVPNGLARYADAGMRHFLARARGERIDPDSNLLHLKHEAWDKLAELELYLQEEERNAQPV